MNQMHAASIPIRCIADSHYSTIYTGHLFSVVYERTSVAEVSLKLHLWSYRPHITLDHLARYMQQQQSEFPILKEFLDKVYNLML